MSTSFSVRSKLASTPCGDAEAIRERLLALSGVLATMPYPLDGYRDDSRLAWLYAVEKDMDVLDVAQELAAVHYLHQETEYPAECQQRLRAAADLIHAEMPQLQWNDLWKDMISYGVPVIKYATMQGADGSVHADALAAAPVVT